MELIVVHLLSATICFLNQCYPALTGRDTPLGEYSLVHVSVTEPGYGGDVLAFARDASGVYAIHRVWTGKATEQRLKRLKYGSAGQRTTITAGCINVMPDVYRRLVDCCSAATLLIESH
ncbi:murein L,D-transpeptidase [Burkholderia territorii]|uniref:murein L,D-transpeptidase n=1 Tax=Burkholderia territorii TaxID=1503055 RepID=UPI000ACC9238|nr:murein L,D-transpeptidase [Burkholderia territorii]